ncbi:MAG: hypothetical protein JOY82_11650 [Streptosporangiaceae bacterium]|nr:hypothetical protein [Streptosporangiaceae bacterium]
MTDYRKLFADIQERPNSYGLDGSYAQAVAFIMGCDAGNSWGLLTGFREWLAMKVGHGTNLGWPALVLRAAFPPPPVIVPADTLDETQEAHAVGTLFSLLDDFLETRSGSSGPALIFTEYAKWAGRGE